MDSISSFTKEELTELLIILNAHLQEFTCHESSYRLRDKIKIMIDEFKKPHERFADQECLIKG